MEKNFYQSLNGTFETEKSKIKKGVSKERWHIAQESEREYWENFDETTLLKEEIGRHKKKSNILLKELSKFMKINKNTKILQVGCGPEDVINYFTMGKRYAIDPLADFYKKKFKLDYTGTKVIQGRGESLPFKEKYFDIVILANVLDHSEEPKKVLSEIQRVLKDDGIFYFENLFYQKNFIRIARIFGKFKEIITKKIFNIHHPHMFTLQDLKKLISGKFSIIHEEACREIAAYDNLEQLKKQKKNQKKLTIKIPAYFGLYGTINYTSVCKKSLNKID